MPIYFKAFKKGYIWFTLSLLITLNNSAKAQELSVQDSTLLRQAASQEIQLSQKNRIIRNATIAVSGAAIWTLTFTFVDEPVQQFMDDHHYTLTDNLSAVMQPLGRQKYIMPVAGAALVTGLIAKDKKLQQVGVISLGSIILNSAVTSTLKNTFHRYRPNATSENHEFDEPFCGSSNTSLPSSHTSTAFAVATSIATVYQDNKYVPPIAYGVATLVGLSRINDNAHWTTDVLAGAAVGYFTSKGVSLLYNLADKRLHKQKLLITPQISLNTGSLSATYVF